jgi:predicted XRE-type DNA-binding protein
MKPTRKDTQVIKSSGNFFADLLLPDPDGDLYKADLVIQICRIVKERGLTQAKAAEVLGIDQPRVSDLMRGKIGRFSTERLFQFLNALGRGIEIVILPILEKSRQAGVRVVGIAPAREKAGAS